MSKEQPTLKIRMAFPEDAGSNWGRDCSAVAADIVGDKGTVLDAKWGREPTKWRESGGGWGRPKLSTFDDGYLAACHASVGPDDTIVKDLLAIIGRLVKS